MIGYEQNWINCNGLYQSHKLGRDSASVIPTNKLAIEEIEAVCDEMKGTSTGYNISVSSQGLEALLADMKTVAKHIEAQKKSEICSSTLPTEKSSSKKSKQKSAKGSQSVDAPRQILSTFLAWLKKAAKKYKLLKGRCSTIEPLTVDAQSLLGEESRCQTLKEVLNNEESTKSFRKFLAKELSEENLDFYLAVEDYKKQTEEEQQNNALKLFDDFIASCSPNEVNVDCQVRKQTKENLRSPDACTFDMAQRHIYRLMETDSFRRFSEQLR